MMNSADWTFELKEIETLRGHTGQVCCIAWNPATGFDGVPAMIASGCSDRSVVIWEQNTATGSFQRKEVLEKMHHSAVTSCAWVTSRSLLLTSPVHGRPYIWKSYKGRFRFTNFFKEYDNLVANVSLYTSGELIAISAPQTDIRIWKLTSVLGSVEPVSSVKDSKGCARMIRWHPLKNILFSCGIGHTIKIWVPDAGMVNWDCIQTLGESNSGRDHTIQALALNDRGNKIVACSDDTINIWSLDIDMMRYGERNAPGKHVCTLTGYHDLTILSVHWSREEIICTGAADGAMCFFIKNGDESNMACSGSSKMQETRMRKLDEPAYKLLLKKDRAHGRDIKSVQWSPQRQDNSRLASASDDGTIKIWELASIPRV